MAVRLTARPDPKFLISVVGQTAPALLPRASFATRHSPSNSSLLINTVDVRSRRSLAASGELDVRFGKRKQLRLGRELPILIASFDGYFTDCGALKAAVQSADRKRPCSQFYSKTISEKAGKSGISAVWRTIQNEDENWVVAIYPMNL